MNKLLRTALLVSMLIAACAANAQSWARTYEQGLESARRAKWSEARAYFRLAASYRPEDASAPTNLPGPAAERRQWRQGAPYSPNFLAAYALYRQSLSEKGAQQANDLHAAAKEFETLLSKAQYSRETFLFLDAIYSRLGDSASRLAAEDRLSKSQEKLKWRVDTEVISAEDRSALRGLGALPGGVIAVKTEDRPATAVSPTTGSPIPGRVMALPSKFALIIGNSAGRYPDHCQPNSR